MRALQVDERDGLVLSRPAFPERLRRLGGCGAPLAAAIDESENGSRLSRGPSR